MRVDAVTLIQFLRFRNLFFELVHQHLLPTLRHTALPPVADRVLLYVQHIGQSAYPASRFDCCVQNVHTALYHICEVNLLGKVPIKKVKKGLQGITFVI